MAEADIIMTVAVILMCWQCCLTGVMGKFIGNLQWKLTVLNLTRIRNWPRRSGSYLCLIV